MSQSFKLVDLTLTHYSKCNHSVQVGILVHDSVLLSPVAGLGRALAPLHAVFMENAGTGGLAIAVDAI